MFDTEWDEEKTDRHLLAARAAKFGVSYLDDALVGLLPNDLMLIGARTGRGKTELATTLAQNMAREMRQVAFFALEADRWEIHRRMKYRKLAQLFYRNYPGSGLRFPRYTDWLTLGLSPEWDAIEREAEHELKLDTSTLRILYKAETYTADDFVRELDGIGSETDVVIIDHLHYFDFFGTSEAEGLKRSIHAIRSAAIHHSKPVILLAHLRKGERNSRKTLPDLEDFHGHSDIVKVATIVLLLSPIPPDQVRDLGSYPTYFHIAKARRASEVTPFVGCLGFDLKTNAYSDRYYVERASYTADPAEITDTKDIPPWCKSEPAGVESDQSPCRLRKTQRQGG